MAKKPNDAGRGGYELQGYTPGDDPAQAVHDEQLASLSDAQLDGLAQAIKAFMDRKRIEGADGGPAQVIPFSAKGKRYPSPRVSNPAQPKNASHWSSGR
jgi:hypothetical protein